MKIVVHVRNAWPWHPLRPLSALYIDGYFNLLRLNMSSRAWDLGSKEMFWKLQTRKYKDCGTFCHSNTPCPIHSTALHVIYSYDFNLQLQLSMLYTLNKRKCYPAVDQILPKAYQFSYFFQKIFSRKS